MFVVNILIISYVVESSEYIITVINVVMKLTFYIFFFFGSHLPLNDNFTIFIMKKKTDRNLGIFTN